MNNEKFYVIITRNYLTSYGNEEVIFKKDDRVFGYNNDIFEYKGKKMFLAHNERYGFPIGFLPICVTNYDIEKQKEEARNINALVEHLINLIESNDERYSFEFAVGGTMEIYDKKSDIGYAVHIEPIKYDAD